MPTLAPIHPGEILDEEFLKPMNLTANALAEGLNVPVKIIDEIISGERDLTADVALRLARFFGTTEQFWMNLQSRYALEVERDRLGDRLVREVMVYRGAG